MAPTTIADSEEGRYELVTEHNLIFYLKLSPCCECLFFLLGDSPASEFYVPTFSEHCSIFIGRTDVSEQCPDSVPKRRHKNISRRIITQKKAYNTPLFPHQSNFEDGIGIKLWSLTATFKQWVPPP